MLIYKITNNLNNKCYIGQTIKTPEDRWKEHKQHAFGQHPNDQNKKLYIAMRENGIENFSFEVIQDGIETFEELDAAEIYWIDYYKAFLEGYNMNRGGQQFHHFLSTKEIVEDYLKTKSARKTAENFNIDHSTVDDIINRSGIKRFTQREALGIKVRIKKDDFVKEFNSIIDCAEWFANSGITKTKNPESVRTSLKEVRRKGTNKYYGFDIETFSE